MSSTAPISTGRARNTRTISSQRPPENEIRPAATGLRQDEKEQAAKVCFFFTGIANGEAWRPFPALVFSPAGKYIIYKGTGPKPADLRIFPFLIPFPPSLHFSLFLLPPSLQARFPGPTRRLDPSRRCRHEVALQGVRALFPEAQQRGRVPRVCKEGRDAEILLRETEVHRPQLREAGTGALIRPSFACL